MLQNGQTNLENLAANAASLLKYVWPFWDITERLNSVYTTAVSFYQNFPVHEEQNGHQCHVLLNNFLDSASLTFKFVTCNSSLFDCFLMYFMKAPISSSTLLELNHEA